VPEALWDCQGLVQVQVYQQICNERNPADAQHLLVGITTNALKRTFYSFTKKKFTAA
jgi:hypothetical protein